MAVLSLCLVGGCGATTIVVVITPTGMVIGADGKIAETTNGTAVKVVLLKQQLIIGSLNDHTVKENGTGRVLYDFPSWIAGLDKKTSAKVSVTDFSSIIENNIPSTFHFFADAIERGWVTKDNAAGYGLNPDVYIVQYVVAGYENGGAIVHWITLFPDWERHTLHEPRDLIQYPRQGEVANTYMQPFGFHEAIDRTDVANTDEEREIVKRIPIEWRILNQRGSLTLRQASNVVRSLVAMEAKSQPSYVGFPITVVTVPKIGKGFARTYKTDVSALSSLPKPKSRKTQQKRH